MPAVEWSGVEPVTHRIGTHLDVGALGQEVGVLQHWTEAAHVELAQRLPRQLLAELGAVTQEHDAVGIADRHGREREGAAADRTA